MQGKYAETVEIQRELVVHKTRLLGAEHESTLIVANNLALMLSVCDQKTEGEQLLRETLTLALRALGPNREFTQRLLQELRALALVAR